MNCPLCQRKNSHGNLFCGSCGGRLSAEETRATAPRPKKKRGVLWILGVLLVVGLGKGLKLQTLRGAAMDAQRQAQYERIRSSMNNRPWTVPTRAVPTRNRTIDRHARSRTQLQDRRQQRSGSW